MELYYMTTIAHNHHNDLLREAERERLAQEAAKDAKSGSLWQHLIAAVEQVNHRATPAPSTLKPVGKRAAAGL
jgi:hypothetical protein